MISLVNEFSALLDTCTILPISLCDLLLRLAEAPAFYKPKWSTDILNELERNLVGPKFNLSAAKAKYRIASMTSAFPEAMIEGYGALIPAMPNEVKDRHVLAAAVFGKVDAIVTANMKDFPRKHLDPLEIEVLTPDEFLVHQWHLDSNLVRSRVFAQISDYKKSSDVHLALMARMVPRFVGLLRASNDPDEPETPEAEAAKL